MNVEHVVAEAAMHGEPAVVKAHQMLAPHMPWQRLDGSIIRKAAVTKWKKHLFAGRVEITIADIEPLPILYLPTGTRKPVIGRNILLFKREGLCKFTTGIGLPEQDICDGSAACLT